VGNIDDVPTAAELCRRLVAQYRAAKETWTGEILAGLAEANRGDFASNEEVASVINKYMKRR
jgi:predicted transcriptional regulator